MKMQQIKVLAVLVSIVLLGVSACSKSGSSPRETFKAFYDAALKRDIEGMKKNLSRDSLKYYEGAAQAAHKTLDQGLRDSAEAIPQKMPETRNETVSGDAATLEIKDDKSEKWDTIDFVKEDNAWKLALDKTAKR